MKSLTTLKTVLRPKLLTALVTPMLGEQAESVNEPLFRRLIAQQIEQGVEGLIILGTTGEASTLDDEEQERLLTIARECIPPHIAFWAGTGSNCTRDAIRKTKLAKKIGADAALIVAPYYNRPTQEGLYCHYRALLDASDMPIVLYNVPSRTGVNIEPATTVRLAQDSRVIAIKECHFAQFSQLQRLLEDQGLAKSFKIYSGDDALALPMLAQGAAGLISVASNLIPSKIVDLVQFSLKGELGKAQALHLELLEFFSACFVESNPVPIKAAMSLCSLTVGGARLPLVPLQRESLEKLKRSLENLQLLHL